MFPYMPAKVTMHELQNQKAILEELLLSKKERNLTWMFIMNMNMHYRFCL